MTQRILSDAQIEHFLQRGHVTLHDCFDPEPCEKWKARAFERLGYNPDDPATWVNSRPPLPEETRVRIRDFAPKAYQASCELVGGEERIAEPFTTGDCFILNLGIGADKPWEPPSPKVGGWHKDGNFFRHFLDSPEQGLLTIFIFSDIQPRGGGTFVACDSVPPMARLLAAHPEGLLPGEMKEGVRDALAQCNDFIEVTGRTGDVVLMHPYLLHASSQNVLKVARFITNPPVHLKEPMNFNREDPADFSPVERAVLRGLRVERLDFRPAGQREKFRPGGRKAPDPMAQPN